MKKDLAEHVVDDHGFGSASDDSREKLIERARAIWPFDGGLWRYHACDHNISGADHDHPDENDAIRDEWRRFFLGLVTRNN